MNGREEGEEGRRGQSDPDKELITRPSLLPDGQVKVGWGALVPVLGYYMEQNTKTVLTWLPKPTLESPTKRHSTGRPASYLKSLC